jgi:hypothetical protein
MIGAKEDSLAFRSANRRRRSSCHEGSAILAIFANQVKGLRPMAIVPTARLLRQESISSGDHNTPSALVQRSISQFGLYCTSSSCCITTTIRPSTSSYSTILSSLVHLTPWVVFCSRSVMLVQSGNRSCALILPRLSFLETAGLF